MKSLIDDAFRFHHKALNVQAYRQELLSANIANADTPHFKARDIDFKSALHDVLDGRRSPHLALSATSVGHIVAPQDGVNTSFEMYQGYRQEWQSNVDGNTVDMDTERAAFAENSLHYAASVRFISGLVQGMRRAIAGQ